MEPTPPGRFRLEINPGQQCGTGQHPCTQLCLEAMERIIRPGDAVLDVGSGSGILSIAAKLLGAGRVVACDIDPEAARVAPFFIGSADAVRSNAFDVVVANISDAVIGELRGELERVAPQRILSGFQNRNGQWTCIVC
jgi:ribosomal protein L11 methyltransferase